MILDPATLTISINHHELLMVLRELLQDSELARVLQFTPTLIG